MIYRLSFYVSVSTIALSNNHSRRLNHTKHLLASDNFFFVLVHLHVFSVVSKQKGLSHNEHKELARGLKKQKEPKTKKNISILFFFYGYIAKAEKKSGT
jgi:hypothetical protein